MISRSFIHDSDSSEILMSLFSQFRRGGGATFVIQDFKKSVCTLLEGGGTVESRLLSGSFIQKWAEKEACRVIKV